MLEFSGQLLRLVDLADLELVLVVAYHAYEALNLVFIEIIFLLRLLFFFVGDQAFSLGILHLFGGPLVVDIVSHLQYLVLVFLLEVFLDQGGEVVDVLDLLAVQVVLSDMVVLVVYYYHHN